MLGSTTSLVRPAAAVTNSPFTKFFRSATLAPGCTVAVKVRLLRAMFLATALTP